MLGEFLTSSAANLVGFVGFEIGSELISRAAKMIPNPKDRAAAEKLIPTFWKLLTTPVSKQNKEDLLALGLLFENVLKILEDPDLRQKWWSFAVRNRIATGDFMAGVSVMTASAMATTRIASCIPNPAVKYFAAPMIGAAFGVGAGVAIGYVPKDTKDSVTRGFQTARMKASVAQIQTAQINLRENIRIIENEEKFLKMLGPKRNGADFKQTNRLKMVEDDLATITAARNDLFTAYYDRIYHLNSWSYEIENKRTIAKEHGNTQAVTSLESQQATLGEIFKNSDKEIARGLDMELAFFTNALSKTTEPSAKQQLQAQQQMVQNLKRFNLPYVNLMGARYGENGAIVSSGTFTGDNTRDMSQPPENSELMMSEEEGQRLLEKIYMWGFKDDVFVKTMKYNN